MAKQFIIPGVNVRTTDEENKVKSYNTQLFGALDNTKTVFNADTNCDFYVVANVPHFKLGTSNGKSNEGYDTVEDAYNAVKAMSEFINANDIPIKLIVHIAEDLATHKYVILKTVVKGKDSK